MSNPYLSTLTDAAVRATLRQLVTDAKRALARDGLPPTPQLRSLERWLARNAAPLQSPVAQQDSTKDTQGGQESGLTGTDNRDSADSKKERKGGN